MSPQQHRFSFEYEVDDVATCYQRQIDVALTSCASRDKAVQYGGDRIALVSLHMIINHFFSHYVQIFDWPEYTLCPGKK